MSVKHFKNGRLNLLAGPSAPNTFTGTRDEVMQAISDGIIKEDYLVYITDDVTAGGAEILDSYEEIIANTDEGKVTGALGVKEGFEKVEEIEGNLADLLKTYYYNSGETVKSYTQNTFTYTGVNFYVGPRETAIFTQTTNNRSSGNPTIEFGYAINTASAGIGSIAGRVKHNSVEQYQSISSTNVVYNNGDNGITVYLYIRPSANISLSYDTVTVLRAKVTQA